MRRIFALCAMVCFFLASAGISLAQYETASVLGYVHDATGAAISNVTVDLQNKETGTKTTVKTNAQGAYEFNSVKVGTWQVVAQAEGFIPASTTPFSVEVAARQRVDLILKVGSKDETITVLGDAAAILETDSSSNGQVIGTREVEDLPLNGRAYADLVTLAPGIRRNNLENQTVTSRDASYNVNGQRSEFNDFMLDGLDNNAYGTSNQGFSNQAIPPAPDAISEFRAETNNYSAEYGRASGAVINVSIRSGTNQMHGAVWEYFRNTVLNAIGPFAAPTNKVTGAAQKAMLNRNQFGGRFGGHILRDRLFYFADYEGNRQVQGNYTTATVPNDNQRQGNFYTTTGTVVPLRNPITGTVYSNGSVPKSDWTPLAVLVMNALPPANIRNSFSSNYAWVPKSHLTDNKGDGRIDFTLNANTTLFGRYSQYRGTIVDASTVPGEAGDGGNGTIHAYNRQIVAGVTRVLGRSSMLDARLGFTWTEGGKNPYLSGEESMNTQAGITGLPSDTRVIRRLSNESVKDFSTFGAATSSLQFQNPFVINPKVNYATAYGRHSVKYGWEFLSINTEVDDFNPVYGGETFNGAFSQYGGGTSDTGAAEAAYLTDFLVGARDSYQLNNYAIVNYHQWMNFFYAQDDYRVTPKLTINAGLRYELVTPQYVDGNHLANFDPSSQTMMQAQSGSLYNRALVHTPKLDFAPRIGLAYQLTRKNVVRAAYGISYDQFNREGGENLLAYNGPYIVNASINSSVGTSASNTVQVPAYAYGARFVNSACAGDNYSNCFRTVAQGYPSNFTSSSNYSTLLSQTRYIPKNISTGYVQSWHLDLQHEFSKNDALTLSYVGEHGVHIWVLADYNQAAANATGGSLGVQARRPISTFTTIEESLPAGFMTYSALQAKYEHHFSQGLYVLNSFTWSHTIDNASGHLDTPNGDNSRINLANINGERGQSAYNQPINETLSAVWDLPFGRGRQFFKQLPSVLEQVVGGWQLTAINTATSGQPVNIYYSPSAAYTLSSLLTQRPNISGKAINPKSAWSKTSTALNGYLNSSAVTVPTDASKPYGNVGRNSIRDMDFKQLDLGLHKSFHLWSEKSRLDFRGEAFNLFNHINYQAPTSSRSSGSYGAITTYFPPRQIQLAARIEF